MSVAGPACVALGLMDWLLRLPGWFRLIVMVGLLAVAGWWLWGRLSRALAFGPTLADLALRAERLFPDLRGWLASGLELSGLHTTPALAGMPRTIEDPLAEATIREAQRRATGRHFGQLVDPTATRRAAFGALVGLLVLVGVVAASPVSANIAAQRWLLPLGDAAWPKRIEVVPVDWPAVVAADTPVRLIAEVTRGATEGMRVWLAYRFEHEPEQGATWVGPTQRVLMNPLAAAASAASDEAIALDGPRFSVQVDPPADLLRRMPGGPGAARLVATLEAGDDTTEPIAIPVVLRPGLASATATVVPPAYARPYQPTQQVNLPVSAERLGTINALQGAQLELQFTLTMPIDPNTDADRARGWFTGLADQAELELADRTLTLRQRVDEPTTVALLLEDAFGLTDTATRRLRLLTTADAVPTVGILEPATDLSLLPTAELPVRVQASDDVALTELRVAVGVPQREEQSGDPPSAENGVRIETLAARPGPSVELAAELTLKLADYDLRPGDVVVLDGIAQDVFDSALGDRSPTAAVPRRLTIIDAATLLSEIQRELAAVRRTAERLRIEQSGLRRAEPDTPADLAGPQQRLTRGVAPASSRLDAAQQRLEQNKLAEPELDELIAGAGRLLDEAAAASARAAERFAQDTPEGERAARAEQEQAEDKLAELAALLDQGGDALSLRLEIGALRAEQESVALDTRALLPQTAGRSMDELTPQQQAQVRALAERQAQLADKSEDLVRRMGSTAEALAQSSERDADQAAAEALAEAAELARQQGLQQQMQQGAEQAEQNRLSQAGEQQLDALDTLDRMLEQMGQQEAKRRERLQRRLRELAERIERLIADQRALVERLPEVVQEQGAELVLEAEAVASVQGLAEPQASLWQRVIVVQTDAERDPATEPVSPILGEAADAAAKAVGALRTPELASARERQAETIEALERALEAVREAQQQQQEQNAQDQRAKLREAYLALAQRQDALREQTEPIAGKAVPDRRDRAALRQLAEPQTTIGQELLALREQVSGQVVFEAIHGRINAQIDEAINGLRGAAEVEPARIPMQQAAVASGLRGMAEALIPPPPKNDFAEQQGGGGGGGGGGAGEVIPDAAQLKLLRGEQARLMERTARADELRGPNPANPAARDEVRRLAETQRELTGLAERLKLQMQRQQRETQIRPEVTDEAP